MTFRFPVGLETRVEQAVRDWERRDGTARLWRRDATLWTGADESRWMGWLSIAAEQLAALAPLEEFRRQVQADGWRDVLLLGMGGSSLGPEVLGTTLGHTGGWPRLHVLDSTDPAQVRRFERAVDLDRTLVVVSSKSGSTLEPNIFKEYFFDRIASRAGAAHAARQFVAVTDPGSSLERLADDEGFARVFPGMPEIGGRFSALSNFGMVPAAAIGLDVRRLLEGAQAMGEACGPDRPIRDNPGVTLGLALGVAARGGRDKLTVVASPALASLGAWLEQLVAESTGKAGTAIVPVDGERTGEPPVYGDDRLFVYVRDSRGPDPDQDAALDRLARAGHPVVRIDVEDRDDLGAEFFRWEMATAVAGAVLGINPFDQPDVEASKVATRRLTDAYERTGMLPAEAPFFEEAGVRLHTDETNAAALTGAARTRTLAGILEAHLARLGTGDYFGLLAYLDMTDGHVRALQEIRHAVRDRARVATCLGFGPRFLHSTGQAYKGGPNTGVFLQLTCADPEDVPVPGRRFTFGVVKAAQARGDFEVLTARGRRALRLHLTDVAKGLETLGTIIGKT